MTKRECVEEYLRIKDELENVRLNFEDFQESLEFEINKLDEKEKLTESQENYKEWLQEMESSISNAIDELQYAEDYMDEVED